MKTFRLLLIILFSLPVIQAQDLDPFDMLNFDASTGTMKKEEKSKEDADKGSESLENKSSGEITEDAKKEEEFIKIPPEFIGEKGGAPKPMIDITKCPIRVSKASIFFRQYVRTLLHHLSGKVLEFGGSELDLRLVLNFEDLKMLQRYGDSETEVDLHTAHEILTKMIYMAKQVTPDGISSKRLWIEDQLGISIEKLAHTCIVLALLFSFVAFFVRLNFSLRQLIIYLFIMIFVVSVCLTWMSLYKKEASKQHYVITKDMPDHCKKREKQDAGFISVTFSWLSSQFTFQEDKCIDYYEMLLIDPLVKVSPIEALAVTATRFFIAPLRHIAQGISDFVRTLLKDLPIQLWPLVLGSIGIFSFLILFMAYGYRVKLPFGMLTIEPSRQEVRNMIDQRDLRHIEEDLKHVEDVQRNQMLEMKKRQDEMVKNITTLLDNQELSHGQPALTVRTEGSGDASFTKSAKVNQTPSPLKITCSKVKRETTPTPRGDNSGEKSSPEELNKKIKTEINLKNKADTVEDVKICHGQLLDLKGVPIECTDKVENIAPSSKVSNIPVRRRSTEQPPSVSDIGPGEVNGSN